jgi:hypothetical protein
VAAPTPRRQENAGMIQRGVFGRGSWASPCLTPSSIARLGGPSSADGQPKPSTRAVSGGASLIVPCQLKCGHLPKCCHLPLVAAALNGYSC